MVPKDGIIRILTAALFIVAKNTESQMTNNRMILE